MGATKTVLVIDDAVATRERLCRLVAEQARARVVGCAADREEVLSRYGVLRPECIVIDVPTRDSAGFDLVATLRTIAPNSLVIVLTNHATEEFRRRSMAAGADLFLAKATDFERVSEFVLAHGERK